jgi:hypothetical protein
MRALVSTIPYILRKKQQMLVQHEHDLLFEHTPRPLASLAFFSYVRAIKNPYTCGLGILECGVPGKYERYTL